MKSKDAANLEGFSIIAALVQVASTVLTCSNKRSGRAVNGISGLVGANDRSGSLANNEDVSRVAYLTKTAMCLGAHARIQHLK